MTTYDNIIIGSGPAGYTAAIYLGRSGVKPLIIEGFQPGGQLTTTTEVENFPGFPDGIDANDLMENMRKQAIKFGAEILPLAVVKTDLSTQPYTLTLDDGQTLSAKTLIIATGASAKYLGLPDENKYKGKGVSACATCDGFFYRKKVVAVVGGGDTACEEATYLAGLAKQVYMIVRKPYLRASQAMQQRVKATPNIKILFQTNAIGLTGENGVEGVTLKTTAPDNGVEGVTLKTTAPDNGVEGVTLKTATPEDDERIYSLPIDGFFLAIGHTPNSELFRPWVKTDEQGYIITNANNTATSIDSTGDSAAATVKSTDPTGNSVATTATSVEGVFAAGDVADPHYQQAINAAASGCRAAIDAFNYLQTK